MTGSYGDRFHIIDRNQTSNVTLFANFEQKKGKSCGQVRQYGDKKGMLGAKGSQTTDPKSVDFSKKTQHLAWHPH